MEQIPIRRGNPNWTPGVSGNAHGRPVGARGRFSQQFIADLSNAWAEHGATALARTAKEYPDRFVGICSHLIPKDVQLSISTTLPAGLDAEDWQALVGLVAGIKQAMPDARGMKAEAVAEYVGRAIAAYDATPILEATAVTT